jgi:hypothetical protein
MANYPLANSVLMDITRKVTSILEKCYKKLVNNHNCGCGDHDLAIVSSSVWLILIIYIYKKVP